MKAFKISKKALMLLLCTFVVFFAVSASAATRNWTDIENTHGTDPVAHDHVYGEWKITKAPTCINPGTRSRECLFAKDGAHCPYVYVETIPADANAHVKGTTDELVKPTCKTLGESVYECEACHKTVTVKVEYVDHTYETEWTVIEPIHDETKEESGLKYNKCIVCGDTQEIVIPVEHVYGDNFTIVTAPTCSKKGQKLVYCEICKNKKMLPVDIDPNNHVYSGKALAIGTVNCADGGTGIVTCEACGETDYVTIPASEAHDYIEWEYKAAEGTCKDGTNGTVGKTCSVHGDITETKRWKNHIFDENAKTHAATCTDYGYTKGKCIVCGLDNVEVILPVDKSKHSWVEEVLIEPTCVTQGYVFRMCKYDSSHVEYDYIPASCHTYYTEWKIEKEASCYEEGIKTNKCATCNKTITLTIPINPDNHPIDEEDWEIYEENFPTCLKEGIEAAHCDKCVSDEELVFRSVPKHTNTLIECSRTESTCKVEGQIVYNCYLCGEFVYENLPLNPLAHRPSKDYYVTQKPTCHTKGIKSKVCDYCFIPIETKYGEHAQIEIETIPHTVTDWVVTDDPTCTADGMRTRECTAEGCNFTQPEPIPMQHRYKAWAIIESATCEKAGLRVRGCYYCNEEWEEPYFVDCKAGNWTFYSGSDNNICDKGDTFRKSCVTCSRQMEEKTLKEGEHIDLVEGAIEYKVSDLICSRKVDTCNYCKGTVVKSNSHTFTKTKEGVEPTCTTSGYEPSFECFVCKHKVSGKYLPALDHVFEYDEEGTKYCLNCNLYFVKDGVTETCDHFCHNKGTIAKVLNKVLGFFWKLLGKNHFCECGAPHYHQEATTILSKNIIAGGKIQIEYSCTECKVKAKKIVL